MEPTSRDRAIHDSIRHWYNLPQLATFAVARHGYFDSDGGFGVTYPSDLDDYDRAQGEHIPEHHVRVHGFWGPPEGYAYNVPELQYLVILVAILAQNGHSTEAEVVSALVLERRQRIANGEY